MRHYLVRYYDYDLKYFVFPSQWMTDAELRELREMLCSVNRASKSPLNYGILADDVSESEKQEFFSNAIVCVMLLQGKPVGFLYSIRIQQDPIKIFHVGLIQINQNTGIDLVKYSYASVLLIVYRIQGATYFTNITATPASVGIFFEMFSKPWPSHKASLIKPPSKKYVSIAMACYEKYVLKYFKDKDQLKFNKRRFILESTVEDHGFSTDFYSLSRHENLLVNLFCMSWINYQKGTEDLFQVGKFAFVARWRCRWYIVRAIIKWKITSQFARLFS